MPTRKLRQVLVLTFASAVVACGQAPQDPHIAPPESRLPNGKSQKEEILKADHQKSLEDAARLTQLTEELQSELEKNDRHIVAISTLKKLEEIEKIAKRIRGRLRRY